MSDETTREAVERVLLPVFYERHLKGTEPFSNTAYKHLSSDALCYAWSAYADALRVRTRELVAERDAATTAERDRIRHAVAGMRKLVPEYNAVPDDMDASDKEAAIERAIGYNAALADVARIIDAGP